MNCQDGNLYPHDEMNKAWAKPVLDVMTVSDETKETGIIGNDGSDLS